MPEFSHILMSFAVDIPLYIVFLIGVILAVVTWKRHPRVSLLVCIGIVIDCVAMTVGTGLFVWLPNYLIQSGRTQSQLGNVLGIISLCRIFITAAAWGIIITAIFIDRSRPLPAYLAPLLSGNPNAPGAHNG
ncbi:MAG: hypothetical protein NTX50_21400 [Candidatus Sumerlaeota bacterium]|nr:hypothetical protein [Candidatus Sumerlaeota bacterium]